MVSKREICISSTIQKADKIQRDYKKKPARKLRYFITIFTDLSFFFNRILYSCDLFLLQAEQLNSKLIPISFEFLNENKTKLILNSFLFQD